MRRASIRARGLLAATALLGAACALNPLSQRHEVVFVSEAEEEAAGAEAAAAVQAELGLVAEGPLVAYVRTVGERVTAFAPSRSSGWRFAVVDLDEPNAFALPGGWVYVSRGVLELANSEDELANVIAHEVVHVAARHHAQRQARATGVGLLALPGLLVGSLIPGPAGDLVAAPFAMAGAGVLASYSRDQEREADELGQQMAARAGYDPGALAAFLRSLKRDTALRVEEPVMPSWLDTHPSTADRAAEAARRAQGMTFTPRAPSAGSKGFLAEIDGLLVGEDPAEGVFQGQRFLHPDLGFTLVFPEGWDTVNARDAVGALPKQRNAQVSLRLAGKGDDPREAASAFFQQASQQTRIDVARLDALEVNGLPGVRGQAVAAAGRGSVSLDLTWVALAGSIYQIAGVVPKGYSDEHRATFGAVVESFRALTPAERAGIRARRLRIREARAGESLGDFGLRTGNAWTPQQTAVANGLADDARLSGGQRLKIALDEPYRPQ